MGKYKTKTDQVWEKAPYCDCYSEDCNPNSHRLCGLCNMTILYGSHESELSQRNSRFAWNIDHIVPKSRGGDNSLRNLHAVHIMCNRSKGDQSGEY